MNTNTKTLYVGADDSNHAGDAKKGEIIVATFSSLRSDSVVRGLPNTRDRPGTLDWLDSNQRDFRFTILTAEEYRYKADNLVRTTPYLIRHFIAQQRLSPEKLNIYLDGRLGDGERDILRDHFLEMSGMEEVVVSNFIKKRRNRRRHRNGKTKCNELVYRADTLANLLYSTKTFEELCQNKSFMPLEQLPL